MASGILNVNKPKGPTSFGVVRAIKRLPGVTKIGHGGTLDPAADGVLPVLINAATRLAAFLHEWPKTYAATVVFGAVSDTDDAEGVISPAGDPGRVTGERIEAILPAFEGPILQVPPTYSALKQGGEALYRKARRGEAVQVPARRVVIKALRLLDYQAETASARIEVECGSGTYVRSLARDLGVALGPGAYLAALTRLAVGPLRLATAIAPSRLTEMGERWVGELLPMDLPLRGWPALTLDGREVDDIRHGRPVDAPVSAASSYRLLDGEGRLVAWAELDGFRLRPRAVFDP